MSLHATCTSFAHDEPAEVASRLDTQDVEGQFGPGGGIEMTHGRRPIEASSDLPGILKRGEGDGEMTRQHGVGKAPTDKPGGVIGPYDHNAPTRTSDAHEFVQAAPAPMRLIRAERGARDNRIHAVVGQWHMPEDAAPEIDVAEAGCG